DAIAIAQISPDGVIAKNASAAWNGKTFLIAWQEGTTIRAARLAPSLNLIDTTPITIGSGASPRVASSGDEFLVAWENGGNINARHLTATGALDAPLTLGPGTAPAVTRDSSRYFLDRE